MHFGHPVAQAVQDHIAHHRMVAVQCVAAAGKIEILPAFGIDHVKYRRVHSLKMVNRTVFVAFTGVIEHHIQNHFDAGGMKGFHHLLEFLHRPAGPAVFGKGGL